MGIPAAIKRAARLCVPMASACWLWSLAPAAAQVAEFHIECAPADFERLYANYRSNDYIPITLRHGGKVWNQARMRIRGDSSRRLPKKSLKIDLGPEPFFDGSDKLNFNAEYLDLSYMHTVLASRLMQDTGQHSFNAEHARLYINGDFLGLYVRVENMDALFLERRGLDPEGNLYKATRDGASLSPYDDIDGYWEKKTNEDTGREDLENLIFLFNQVPDREFVNFVKAHFDYDGAINIIAMNMLLANGSTYYHNYYMFHDTAGDGKWSMFPWDTDRTFSRYGERLVYHRSSHLWLPDNPFLERALVTGSMLRDIEGRLAELDRWPFSPAHVFPLIDSLETVIAASVAEDTTDDIADDDQWQSHLRHERFFIETRYEILREQISTWPRPFRTRASVPTPEGGHLLLWEATSSLDGSPVTYVLRYGDDPHFPDESFTSVELADTSYTVGPDQVGPGPLYWNVVATNEHGSMEAYDSYNIATGEASPPRADGAAGGVAFNEIYYRSNGDFDSGDWVEIHNSSSDLVDLSGWYFKDEDDGHVFFLPQGTVVGPRSYLVLAQDSEKFRDQYPWVDNQVGDFGFGLNRRGDQVRLYDADGGTVDSLAYADQPPWPDLRGIPGRSIELKSPGADRRLGESWLASILRGTPTTANSTTATAGENELSPNFPNPFNASTAIPFALKNRVVVELEVYNSLGHRVATLVDGRPMAGYNVVDWDGTDERGTAVASGLYIARLRTDNGLTRYRKMVLLK